MILINELFPNPNGKDLGREWVELYNDGSQTINLTGWRLENGAGKKLNLSGEIGGENFLAVKNGGKFILRNTDEKVFLYDSAGRLARETRFWGVAPTGKSWSRLVSGNFIWAEPTPGTRNMQVGVAQVSENIYPFGQVLNRQFSVTDFILTTLGVAAIITGAFVFIIKRNENLSKLFFGGN